MRNWLFNKVLQSVCSLYRKVVNDLRAALLTPLVMSDTEEGQEIERVADTRREHSESATTETLRWFSKFLDYLRITC